jgi:hypothetical protein
MSSFAVKPSPATLKFEIINSKFETISKFKCSKFEITQSKIALSKILSV